MSPYSQPPRLMRERASWPSGAQSSLETGPPICVELVPGMRRCLVQPPRSITPALPAAACRKSRRFQLFDIFHLQTKPHLNGACWMLQGGKCFTIAEEFDLMGSRFDPLKRPVEKK